MKGVVRRATDLFDVLIDMIRRFVQGWRIW